MSENLARFKHKKEIINCIEESWDYFGEDNEKRRVIKELKNVYKIASSAKNAPNPDEAKVKAFDKIMDLYVNGSDKYLRTKHHTLDVFIEDVAEILKPFTDKYESEVNHSELRRDK